MMSRTMERFTGVRLGSEREREREWREGEKGAVTHNNQP